MNITEEDRKVLQEQSRFMNEWMNRTFFGATPPKKIRKGRVKPCPKCGSEIGITKPMCYKCFTTRDESGRIR